MIRRNPCGMLPRVHSSAYIDPSAVVIGDVAIGRNVYVGPCAVVRADEKDSGITIGDGANVQDRVSIHALAGSRVIIEAEVSLAHGCIVHGPCRIGKGSFIGFNSVVFNAALEEEVFVHHLAVVEGGTVVRGSVVHSGMVVPGTGRQKPGKQGGETAFARKVVKVNIELAQGYGAREKEELAPVE
jgi:carbonic anhydrase/acetyltransferase-like protein (isoleucine patch superfamily)